MPETPAQRVARDTAPPRRDRAAPTSRAPVVSAPPTAAASCDAPTPLSPAVGASVRVRAETRTIPISAASVAAPPANLVQPAQPDQADDAPADTETLLEGAGAAQTPRKFPTLSAMISVVPPRTTLQDDIAQIATNTGASLGTALDMDVGLDVGAPATPLDHVDATPGEYGDLQAALDSISHRAARELPHVSRHGTGVPAPAAAARPRPRPLPLPAVNPILPLAGVQVAVAVCGALSGAALLVVGRPAGWWPLALAIITGIGGWLASLLDAHPQRAGWALLISQLIALCWALALVGPRSSLLVVAAVIVLVALWLCGRVGAVAATSLAVALYAADVALAMVGAIHPALVLDVSSGAVFDGAVSCVALLLLLRLALRLHAAALKAEALAAARSFEMEIVRGRAVNLRQQVEGDAERLRQALREAQTGAPAPGVSAAGALSPLADEIDVTAARLHALHRDREQRRQLEHAIYRLARALERAWLGLPWEWPSASGTKLDEIVALLRSPNPREIARAHLDDTSGLLPIPTLDAAHVPPWAPPAPHPLAPLAEPEPLWSSGEMRAAYLDSEQIALQTVLPWDAWDDWRGWDASQEE